jgi:hypothetical protein
MPDMPADPSADPLPEKAVNRLLPALSSIANGFSAKSRKVIGVAFAWLVASRTAVITSAPESRFMPDLLRNGTGSYTI